MDDAGPQSLCVVVSYSYGTPYFSSILHLETKVNNHECAAHLTPLGRPNIKKSLSHSSPVTQLNQKEYVAHFRQPQGYPPITWVFSPLANSTEDLCMVPDWGPWKYQTDFELQGCIFNLRTKKCKPIKPPGPSRFYKHVVALGDHIYFMAHPHRGDYAVCPVFVRYNPLKDLWETLKSFPEHAIDDDLEGIIVASAVWDDTILLNMDGQDGCKIWAYNVGRNKWYPVHVEDEMCYCIVGTAVLLENTIYALTSLNELVLALSIIREQINGDLVFECSIRWKILVPGMEQIKFVHKDAFWRTRHLVHLGKDNFCLVHSCNLFGYNRYQPIQLTHIKLKGENSMTVTEICVHEINILDDEQFNVCLCFSLPEYMTTALKGKRFVFDFNPFLEDYASKQKDKTDFNLYREPEVGKLVQGEEIVTLPKDEEGHTIYVRKLPPDATVRQLEKALKKFGAIKRDGIQVGKNKNGECFAYVEFESATSKQHAIEASTIRIGGCRAEIEEKRRTGLTLGNRTSGSSSFGKNKFKNNGEVSRSPVDTINGGEGGVVISPATQRVSGNNCILKELSKINAQIKFSFT